MAGLEINLEDVKRQLQLLVTQKVKMMNYDSKSVIDRFIEWLGK